ncbi:SDR family oxidoreductase [Streptomyces sp. DT199]|uniref:SDR family oxidoreductase n=1 Tax=Streptomyces sp. DT199 TaxID=3393421 RepID=UPI003CF0BFE4
MTVLIVGGSGFLGTELVRQASAAGHLTAATFATRPVSSPEATWYDLDLRDGDRVEEVVSSLAPCMVINASSGSADWAATAEGSVRLAMTAAKHNCRLVHVSSDAVFSGTRAHYDESCLPDPVTPYGAAKAAAETGIRLLAPDAAIARTSLIIGGIQSEHVRLVHDLATDSRAGSLFTDDIRCPVHVGDLAAALLELASTDARGIHHLAGPDAVSRHALGVLIAHRDGLDASRLPKGLRAATALPGVLDVRLDSRATQAKLRTRLRGVREFL